jgi:hypothetical protein
MAKTNSRRLRQLAVPRPRSRAKRRPAANRGPRDQPSGVDVASASLEPPLQAFDLLHRLTAEALGTALLLAIVIGSGIMGDRLAGGNTAIALLGNTLATGAGLVVLHHHAGACFRRALQSGGTGPPCDRRVILCPLITYPAPFSAASKAPAVGPYSEKLNSPSPVRKSSNVFCCS